MKIGEYDEGNVTVDLNTSGGAVTRFRADSGVSGLTLSDEGEVRIDKSLDDNGVSTDLSLVIAPDGTLVYTVLRNNASAAKVSFDIPGATAVLGDDNTLEVTLESSQYTIRMEVTQTGTLRIVTTPEAALPYLDQLGGDDEVTVTEVDGMVQIITVMDLTEEMEF